MTNLQGITSIECENHHELDPYTYDRSDKCKQEQEYTYTHTDTPSPPLSVMDHI